MADIFSLFHYVKMSNSKQYHILRLLPDDIFNDGFKEEYISDEELTANTSDEENNDKTCYLSETELENLSDREEATGKLRNCSISSFP